MTYINQTYERADAFLFGRRAYELFAGVWGTLTEQDVPGWEPVWEALNTQPKYVAATGLADPIWSRTTVLSGDLATAIAELKAKPGGELQVARVWLLIRWLLETNLVDAMVLVVFPVILTLFTDGPFPESKEYLGGFWIIEAPDRNAALTLAAEGSKACHRRIEVRPSREQGPVSHWAE